jgi:hypothetical protein
MNDEITGDELDRLEALTAAATPEPWESFVSRLCAVASGAVDNAVEVEPEVACLRDDLGCADDVTESAEAMFGGAAGDQVRALSLAAQMLDECLKVPLVANRAVGRVVVELRA